MAVTSSTIGGVNTWTFSGIVTDAQIQTAWSALVTNGVYVINRAIYLDNTCDLTGVTGGFLVDFGTQVNPGIILHTLRDKTKTIFNNFTFLQRTGLSVGDRTKFVQSWNGTVLVALGGGSNDGLQQKGGGLVYGVVGNPGGGDPRYLNEIGLSSLENTTYFSQEYTEQELQPCVGTSTILKNLTFEKCFGFPQIQTLFGNSNVVVYRSTQNTQHPTQLPIRVYPSSLRWASVCYIDSYVTRNNADVTTRLIDMFGSNANQPADVMILNNYTRESWFGASKTTLPVSNWAGGNQIIGGVLKKLQFINGNGGVVKSYDSRSTTASQKTVFAETGFRDFLDTNLSPTTDANGKITMVHVGAICTTNSVVVTRYTGQKYTFQKFGYRVLVGTPDMTIGDNDLSAFTPITLTTQSGISRTQSAINSATIISNFQELLEELHVLAIGLTGSQSYNGAYTGNLFNYDGSTLTTSFTTVNVDATASSKISYNSATNTLTIKSSVLTDNSVITKWSNATGTINLLNGAVIQGVYQTSAGTSTIWEFGATAEPIIAGTSLAIYDGTGTTKYYNAVTSDGVYRYYIAPQSTGATYTYAIERYGYKREEGTFPSNAGGILFYVPSYGEDVGITEATKATVATYTTLSDTAQIYDATANFRLSETGIKLGQLVARDGTYLDFGNFNVKIKDDASAIVAVVSGTITYKSIVINESTKYNAMKATPPKTITPTDTEIINVLIEDANGDSQVSILGGDNESYEIWKIPTTTATDDYATGTLLATLPDNTTPFRFIGISGFDLVGRDTSSGVRRRSSMLKGSYEQAFYVGNQIQLATDAPQLLENNLKLDELILKVDTNLDEKISTRLAEIDYVAPHNAEIDAIKAVTDTLENYDDTITQTKLDALQTSVDTKPTLAEMEHPDSNIAKQDLLNTVLSSVISTDATVNQLAGNDFDAMTDSLDAISTKVDGIKAKTDVLVNTDLTGIATSENVTDAKDEILTEIGNIPATDLTNIEADLNIINEGVQKSSLFIPHTTDL